MADRGRIIFLTGFSGTGKSMVGEIVARLLGWELVDTDELIVERAGRPIVEIFERGEKEFRQLEREVLAEVARGDRRVVPTGGGVPVDERNRAVMQTSGMTVRLKASPETIWDRLGEGLQEASGAEGQRGLIRPMLHEEGEQPPEERIRRLLEQREASYASADETVDTEGMTPQQVADDVVAAWQRFSEAARASG